MDARGTREGHVISRIHTETQLIATSSLCPLFADQVKNQQGALWSLLSGTETCNPQKGTYNFNLWVSQVIGRDKRNQQSPTILLARITLGSWDYFCRMTQLLRELLQLQWLLLKMKGFQPDWNPVYTKISSIYFSKACFYTCIEDQCLYHNHLNFLKHIPTTSFLFGNHHTALSLLCPKTINFPAQKSKVELTRTSSSK